MAKLARTLALPCSERPKEDPPKTIVAFARSVANWLFALQSRFIISLAPAEGTDPHLADPSAKWERPALLSLAAENTMTLPR